MVFSIRRSFILWTNLHNIEDNVIGLNWDGVKGLLHFGIRVVNPLLKNR